MRAIRAHEHGEPDELRMDDINRPVPDSGEVLIDVKATSVNVIDCLLRQGIVPDSMSIEFPWIPGWDVSGTVESVGSSVTAFKPGDVVYGMAQQPKSGQTYAEYCTFPANELTKKPDILSHAEAAALPMCSLTAHHALFKTGRLEAGDTVMVHAAAGGVGHLAVQMADRTGATVYGTASTRNRSYLRDLGVDEFVNYRNERFEDVLPGVDLVIDAVGGEVLRRSIDLTDAGGRIVTLPEPPSEEYRDRADEQDITVEFFSITSTATPGEWLEIDGLVREGVLTPTVSNRFPLSEAPEAHRLSEAGHVRGKLVLDLR